MPLGRPKPKSENSETTTLTTKQQQYSQDRNVSLLSQSGVPGHLQHPTPSCPDGQSTCESPYVLACGER
jgi:hypothetical protein